MPEKKTRKQPREPRAKKPWEPPRVKSGRLFESNSLACTKTHADPDPGCQTQDPTNS
jgi:hypothetical protein